MGIRCCSLRNAELIGVGDKPVHDFSNIEGFAYYAPFMHAVAPLPLPKPMDGIKLYAYFAAQEGPAVEASMSYSGYSYFRDCLAEISGKDELEPGDPFFEMCYMSDNDGFFSHEVVRTIAEDFDDYRYEFKGDTLVRDAYERWAQVFNDAANNNGIVYYT